MLPKEQGTAILECHSLTHIEDNSRISRLTLRTSRHCDPDGYKRNRTEPVSVDRLDPQVTTVASAKSDANRPLFNRLSPDAFTLSASRDSLSQYAH